MNATEFCRMAVRTELANNPKLSMRGWAKAAGVVESGIRGFLSGYQDSITLDYLEKLAIARGKTIFDFLLPVGEAGFAKWLSLLNDEDLKSAHRLFLKSISAAALELGQSQDQASSSSPLPSPKKKAR